MNVLIDTVFGLIVLVLGILIGISVGKHESHKNPYFIVTEMTQCTGNICNAYLRLDDMSVFFTLSSAIIHDTNMNDYSMYVPVDSTQFHVGDTLYLNK